MAGKPDRLDVTPRFAEFAKEARAQDPFLKDLANKEFFFLAMALGVNNKDRRPLTQREGFVRAEYLHESDHALLKAVALSATEDMTVLQSAEQIFGIAEEYAMGGLEHFKALVLEQPGSLVRKLSDLARAACSPKKDGQE
jgi:hypothetical protein